MPASNEEATYNLTILPTNSHIEIAVKNYKVIYEDCAESNYYCA